MNHGISASVTALVLAYSAAGAFGAITLNAAGGFSVLAGSTVTNTGPSVIDGGDVGVSPGSAITGFGPGIVVAPYIIRSADAVTTQGQVDLGLAYDAAAALVRTFDLTGVDLGGLVLTPGVYFFSSSAALTGMLTLDKQGHTDAQFVFQIGSTLITASGSSVLTINDAPDGACNIFWQVGASATLGVGTAFEGHIMAMASITLNTGATVVDGSLLARNGAVTLDTNTVTNCLAIEVIPEPGMAIPAVMGFAGLTCARRRRAC